MAHSEMAHSEMARPASSGATRERRVVMGGALVVVVACAVVYGVVPWVRQWNARELELAAARDRAAYLTTLIARTAQLESDASASESALASSPRRVLHARSAPLGASALQSLLQDAADASHVVVTRLEVSGDATADSSAAAPSSGPSLPATMSVYGDISGVTALLGVLSHGPRVVHVNRVALTRNSALVGAADVVQATLQLSAPVLTP